MNLEELTTKVNANIFLREFSFSKNTFSPRPEQTLELADQVIWIDDILMVCQLKERQEEPGSTAESERKWFENKVLKKAKRQIGDTLKYLKTYEKISIQNQRGHTFEINSRAISIIDKLIMYAPGKHLPEQCRRTKSYPSESAGFIHILPVDNYLGICQTLVTPAEIREYLGWREKILQRWGPEVDDISEQALVGQFLAGTDSDNARPDEHFKKYLLSLKNDLSEFDLRPFLNDFKESLEYSTGENDYYHILTEFARMNRSELQGVKERFMRCIEDSARKDPPDYYRVYCVFPSNQVWCYFRTPPCVLAGSQKKMP
jgi:hypothetical protein